MALVTLVASLALALGLTAATPAGAATATTDSSEHAATASNPVTAAAADSSAHPLPAPKPAAVADSATHATPAAQALADSAREFRAESRSDSAAADTARRHPPTEPTGFERPRWVMLRSLALPAWGQLHNHAWIKAVLVGGSECTLIAKLVDDHHALRGMSRDIDAARAANNTGLANALVETYNARSDKYVAHQWWLGALLAYSMVDAYIDAHFRHFSVDIEDDPALPPEQRHAAGLRLSWQERF